MKITSLVATWLKKDTTPADKLLDDKKIAVARGRTYIVDSILGVKDDHVHVKLADAAGNWWIFKPHWEGLSSQSKLNANLREIQLAVPYYSQRDNQSSEWWRQCSSSSHAMILNFLKPGSVKSDDDYFQRFVGPVGDTTDWGVHTKALEKFGIKSEYRQNLDRQDLIESLQKGFPVAIGVLHKGAIANPIGGHVLVITGVKSDKLTFLANDPWGVPFAYDDHNGKQVEIPWNPSLERRWTADGDNTGWGRIIISVA